MVLFGKSVDVPFIFAVAAPWSPGPAAVAEVDNSVFGDLPVPDGMSAFVGMIMVLNLYILELPPKRTR